jgi:hypothetical protein
MDEVIESEVVVVRLCKSLVYICFSICLVVGIKYAEAATCSVTAACEYGNLKKGPGKEGESVGVC